uniref:NADH dehydrogenase subunit 2 n=1 Tax=Synanthedon bicingulata TaxID=3138307 RepID=UPI00315D49BD
MFFLFILIFSTLISISSSSWFGCWIGLEINLLSFIPLISSSKNLLSSEASLKYFLIQSIASINFLFMILLNLTFLKNTFYIENLNSIMINSSLLMKMGSVPFHFWFINIIEGLSWMNCFILMTWQKITPIILLSYYFNYYFLIFFLILNSIIGAIGGINQTSLRKLMTFSSINNLSWMIFSIIISENLWIMYMITYSLMISILCYMFYIFNLFFFNQIYFLNSNFLFKIFFFFNFLSLGGSPPFLGFFPKWMVINFLIYNENFLLTFIFITMSLITLYFYIRILYSSMLFNYFKLKWFNFMFKFNFNYYFMSIFSFISLGGMIFSTMMFY